MTTGFDPSYMQEISGFVASRMGLHFPEARWTDLARGLKLAGRELDLDDVDGDGRWLLRRNLTVHQLETVASHLTVGETYFFRDPTSFEVLERDILPQLIARRTEANRTLRFWSAGCCTGEEAYSLAITCIQAIPAISEWNISIMGTDINTRFLAKAEAGIYSEWSFRGSSSQRLKHFFQPVQDKKYAIEPVIRKMVHFNYLNLAEDVYPSLHNHTNAMDVIFCRNVLMYFTPDHQRRVVEALHHCLVDGGCLFVNAVEISASLVPMFAMETINGVTFFRKQSQKSAVSTWPGVSEKVPALAFCVPEQIHVDFRIHPLPVEPDLSIGLVEPTAPVASDVLAAPVAPVEMDESTAIGLPDQPRTGPIPVEDPLALARIFANSGRLEEALLLCRGVISTDRTHLVAYFLLATICQELGRHEEASVALGKVLYLDQDFILAHHALADIYKQLGKLKESGRHLAIALQLLDARNRDEIVPESDGMTCGRLIESVRAMKEV